MSMGWRKQSSHMCFVLSDVKSNLRTELHLRKKPLFFTVCGLLESLVIASSTKPIERTEKSAKQDLESGERQEVSSPSLFYNYVTSIHI